MEILAVSALASCASRQFSVCSRAFIRLESFTNMVSEERDANEKLALDIFTKSLNQNALPALPTMHKIFEQDYLFKMQAQSKGQPDQYGRMHGLRNVDSRLQPSLPQLRHEIPNVHRHR